MNTILQKRIEEAANHYLLHEHKSPLNEILHQCDLKTEMQYHKDIEQAYIEGGKNSLQNQWISVEEALPTLDEKYDFSERYIVKTNEGAIKVMRIFKNIAWCDIFDGRAFIPFEKKIVTHWMEIPNEGGEE